MRDTAGVRLCLELGRTETAQDRLRDAGVVEQGVGDRAWLHPWRDHERWHAHPVAGERRGLVIRWVLGRRDVVKEPAVLVVEDQQQRFLPRWTSRQRVVDEQRELLPVSDI